MFAPSRDQARDLFFDTWRKFRAGLPLEGLERLVVGLLTEHPEYHELLDRPDRHKQANYEGGRVNPFLHLSLHLAVEEQLSIDQPIGVRAAYAQLEARHGSAHDAKHVVMACLVETLRDAQVRNGTFDTAAYLRCLTERAGS